MNDDSQTCQARSIPSSYAVYKPSQNLPVNKGQDICKISQNASSTEKTSKSFADELQYTQKQMQLSLTTGCNVIHIHCIQKTHTFVFLQNS